VDRSSDTASGETLQELCEQAGKETDSDKLRQLAHKIVQKLSDRRYRKFDNHTIDDSIRTVKCTRTC
jgi:hypothetical protein